MLKIIFFFHYDDECNIYSQTSVFSNMSVLDQKAKMLCFIYLFILCQSESPAGTHKSFQERYHAMFYLARALLIGHISEPLCVEGNCRCHVRNDENTRPQCLCFP